MPLGSFATKSHDWPQPIGETIEEEPEEFLPAPATDFLAAEPESFDKTMMPSPLRRLWFALLRSLGAIAWLLGILLEGIALLLTYAMSAPYALSDRLITRAEARPLPRFKTTAAMVKNFEKRSLPELDVAEDEGLRVTLGLFVEKSDAGHHVAIDVGSLFETTRVLMHHGGLTANDAQLDALLLVDDAVTWHTDHEDGPDTVQLAPRACRAGLVTVTAYRVPPLQMGKESVDG